MARLAELEQIAREEEEAEIARQAAELSGMFWMKINDQQISQRS